MGGLKVRFVFFLVKPASTCTFQSFIQHISISLQQKIEYSLLNALIDTREQKSRLSEVVTIATLCSDAFHYNPTLCH